MVIRYNDENFRNSVELYLSDIFSNMEDDLLNILSKNNITYEDYIKIIELYKNRIRTELSNLLNPNENILLSYTKIHEAKLIDKILISGNYVYIKVLRENENIYAYILTYDNIFRYLLIRINDNKIIEHFYINDSIICEVIERLLVNYLKWSYHNLSQYDMYTKYILDLAVNIKFIHTVDYHTWIIDDIIIKVYKDSKYTSNVKTKELSELFTKLLQNGNYLSDDVLSQGD